MSGVWVFRNGVVKLVENPPASANSGGGGGGGGGGGIRRKALLHMPTGEFHKRSSVDLISLPKDFSQFGSVHMYDIVVKNRDAFRVIDV
ncbi:hypothetical protein OsI_05075 [Oryza sativa Indica Group]|uniref:Uncharacterized protein n=1 Tax=Oryza sativa subsp. indica TaxID=39946 RepID=B8A8T1_ORYSI|nr:hypothetical protein OsI_05075 [Oryza sativa Indica Group]